jgi:hypothetical protein
VGAEPAVYPDVTLADAREAFDIAKVKVKNGLDPLEEKNQAELERKQTPFVADFVAEYIENHAKKHNKGWKEIERALKPSIAIRGYIRGYTEHFINKKVTTFRL